MLSSGTREESRCHSTHSNSSGDSSSIMEGGHGSSMMADSTISSLSTESLVEIGGSTHKTSASSASFVQLEEDGKEEDALEVGEEVEEMEEEGKMEGGQHFVELGGRESWHQLEKRFQVRNKFLFKCLNEDFFLYFCTACHGELPS